MYDQQTYGAAAAQSSTVQRQGSNTHMGAAGAGNRGGKGAGGRGGGSIFN